jgi:hypothetical protein
MTGRHVGVSDFSPRHALLNRVRPTRGMKDFKSRLSGWRSGDARQA